VGFAAAFSLGKLDCGDAHQLTQRIVLCIRDDLEDPEAATKPVNDRSPRQGKQP